MKRPSTLSAAFVRTITDPGRFGDGRGGHGLSLLVARRKNGRVYRRWTQRVEIDGKYTSLGLGVYPEVTLAEARRRALRNRQALAEGRNPRRTVPTFQQATEAVILLQGKRWKSESRTAQIWRSSLQRYAGSLSEVRVDRITTGQVLACLSPIWHTKNETAMKVRRRISSLMKWSIAQGFRQDNPADDRVTAALGRNTRPPTHQKAIHHSKVGTAVDTIEETGAYWATKAALRFLILTATRSGETRNATWNEIDLDGRVWTIPADRTKTARELRVPLSTGVLEVLREARRNTGGAGLVFPSPTGRVLSNATMSKLCKVNNVGCVPHGFRTSFRSWCSDSGVSREVAEMALGHVVSGVEGAYARSDLLEARRPIMERWGKYLDKTDANSYNRTH